MPEEYISREAVRRMVNQLPRYTWSSPVSTDYCVAVSKDKMLLGLGRIPAADVAPVVHGEWIGNKGGFWEMATCTVCVTRNIPALAWHRISAPTAARGWTVPPNERAAVCAR